MIIRRLASWEDLWDTDADTCYQDNHIRESVHGCVGHLDTETTQPKTKRRIGFKPHIRVLADCVERET